MQRPFDRTGTIANTDYMPLSWSFYAFDYARFQKGAFDAHIGLSKLKNFLSGPESDCPDREVLTKETLDLLGKGAFDYGKLPKKHWKYLDAYIRVYVRDVMAGDALSESPSGADKWQELLRFYLDRNGKDVIPFSALAQGGRRHAGPTEKSNWFSGIADLLYKRSERYLILEGEELDRFCRHLQALFYVNPWDWPTYLPAQELLKPIMLEPFLSAREKGLAVFGVLGEQAESNQPARENSVEVELEPAQGKELAGLA